jgi:hypothetical protein
LGFELLQEVAPYGAYIIGIAIFEHAVKPVSDISGPRGYRGALDEGEGQCRSAEWGADEYIAPVETVVLFQAVQESVGVGGITVEEFGWGSYEAAIVAVSDHVVVIVAPTASTASTASTSTASSASSTASPSTASAVVVAVVSVTGVVVRSPAYGSAIERARGFLRELFPAFLGRLVIVFAQLQEFLFHFSDLLVRPIWGEGLVHDGVLDMMVTGRSELFGHLSDDRGNVEWW